MMYVYFNAFRNGLIDNTDSISFFINLLKNVFETDINVGSIEQSDILFESVYGESVVTYKSWKYSFMFSGESDCPNDPYTAILSQSRSYKNVIHCPLFIVYSKSNDTVNDHSFDSLNVNFNTIVNDIKRVIFNEYNISKIICIGSRETEPDRYIHLNKELHSLGIEEYLIEWNLPCFRDTIDFNSSLIKKFRLEGMFGPEELYRKKGNLSQLSLMINYYIIFKNILNYYKEGNFMILESDVIITEPDLVKKLLTCTYPNFDTINFGSGCNMIINSDTGAIEFHTKKTTRCTDSQIFSYAGIEKYVTYMESAMTFYTSIDFWMNDVINNTDIVYLWTSPSLTKQGSQHQLFDSFTEC